MKFSILYLFIVLLMVKSSAQVGPNAYDKKAIRMLHTFYNVYLSIDPTKDIDEMPIRKKYCTSKFLDKYYYHPKEGEELDADPFVKAQDSDPSWLKTLSVNIDYKNPKWYIAEYTDLTSFKHVVIHLKVVKQDTRYLIDEVW